MATGGPGRVFRGADSYEPPSPLSRGDFCQSHPRSILMGSPLLIAFFSPGASDLVDSRPF